MSKKWLDGKVRWFDDASGWGVITDNKDKAYEVHWSAVDTSETWRTLTENSKVKFVPLNDPDFMVVEKVKEVL